MTPDYPLSVVKQVGPQDVSVSDSSNPRSIVNLVPPVVGEAIKRVPDELLQLSEKELEDLTPLKAFTVVDRRLRTAFWLEYVRAQDTHTKMNMASVYGGICSRGYFYTSIVQDKTRMSYLLHQPTDYRMAMEEALSFGVDRVREILSMPLYDPSGRPDPKMADVVLKAFAVIDQRVKGAVVQKVHQINQNLGGRDAPQPGPQSKSMEEIDRQLAELESKLGGKKHVAEDIVIENAEVLDGE